MYVISSLSYWVKLNTNLLHSPLNPQDDSVLVQSEEYLLMLYTPLHILAMYSHYEKPKCFFTFIQCCQK